MSEPHRPGTAPSDWLAGVIEGFYGKPWTQPERLQLFEWMAAWGLNTYLYAPKDDPKHRALWREPYTPAECETLAELVQACQTRHLRFVYALSPGLDIRYRHEEDLDRLRTRLGQMLSLGCEHFALLFDDIPDRLDADTSRRWGSLAAAQSAVTNEMFRWARTRCPQARFLFCPTPYCGRMVERGHGGADYLAVLGKNLLTEIDVFWTGPEIVSREISPEHVGQIERQLQRKPLIWDNLHANDYDGNRFFCGPYAGRPPALRDAVRGILSNPNTEFPLNYVPIRTLADFVHCAGTWRPREAYLAAVREWLPQFDTLRSRVTVEDLVLLCDCYYLPHEEGPEAQELYDLARSLLAQPPSQWGQRAATFRTLAGRLRMLCAQLAELRDRPLFYALSRRIWELREELDLLDRCVELNQGLDRSQAGCCSDFHLPGTYRGGLVRRLQQLLEPKADGAFVAAVGATDLSGPRAPEDTHPAS